MRQTVQELEHFIGDQTRVSAVTLVAFDIDFVRVLPQSLHSAEFNEWPEVCLRVEKGPLSNNFERTYLSSYLY